MDLELLKKLNHFNLYANLGFSFDEIIEYDKYIVSYHNKIKDYWYNFITSVDAKNKKEFDKVMEEASSKMKTKNRDAVVLVLPFMKEIYENREIFFKDNYELISNEVWQIFDEFEKAHEIKTNCPCEIVLEKAEDMKKYAEEMVKMYRTGDKEDPYGDLDPVYKEVYENFKSQSNIYTNEFFFVKSNGEIVGITSGVYDDEIYGIYGLVVKKDSRCKGIGKEIIKKQLEMCRDRNLKMAFLQTEDGFYPADMYRKIGFKDACVGYYYKKVK